MKEANYKNLIKDKCPHDNSQLEINPKCGRRKCLTKNCFFTISKETLENLITRLF